jgi:16S rRNA (guanine527-N7)-methyltransferase
VPAESLEAVLADAQRIGLLGPEPVERHVEHASAWAGALEPSDFLDLGSGAGVPGLVLATLWPDRHATLLDGQLRRTAWLRTAVVRLGLTSRVTVLEGRAEDLGHTPRHREAYRLAVARGFGPPATTAECGGAFVAIGGTLSVSDVPGGSSSRWPAEGLSRLGLEMSTQVVHPSGSFVILRRHAPLEGDLPRRRNLPLKRPLWS